MTLRILLLVNLMLAGQVLAQGSNLSLSGFVGGFLDGASYAEPIMIASLVLLCPLRTWLRRYSYWIGVAAVAAVQLLLTAGLRAVLSSDETGFEIELALHDWLVACMVCAVVLYYFYLRERAFSPAISEARLQALQARIRPHFLFNSLTAVLSLIRTEPKRAERTLEDLADLFRVLLREERRAVLLEEEIDMCRRYLEIESLRLGERLQVEWRVDAEVKRVGIPPLILQPLVENAVHHGIEPSAEPGLILITVARKGRTVEIEIINPRVDGNTRPPGRTGNHMALDNVRERLALHYDVEARLEAGAGEGEYRVKIVLPARDLVAPGVERRK